MFQIQPVSPPAPACFQPMTFQTEASALVVVIVDGYTEVNHPSGTVWVHPDTRCVVKIVEVQA